MLLQKVQKVGGNAAHRRNPRWHRDLSEIASLLTYDVAVIVIRENESPSFCKNPAAITNARRHDMEGEPAAAAALFVWAYVALKRRFKLIKCSDLGVVQLNAVGYFHVTSPKETYGRPAP
jgi:hypothetical protein